MEEIDIGRTSNSGNLRLILHLNYWTTILLAVLYYPNRYRNVLEHIYKCYDGPIRSQVEDLKRRMAPTQLGDHSVEPLEAIGQNPDSARQLKAYGQVEDLGFWLDGLIISNANKYTLDNADLMSFTMEEVHLDQRGHVAHEIGLDVIIGWEKQRLQDVLAPTVPCRQTLKMGIGTFLFGYSYVADWILVISQFETGKTLAACATLYFMHQLALICLLYPSAIFSEGTLSKGCICLRLPPFVQMAMSWQSCRLSIAMSRESQPLESRFRSKMEYDNLVDTNNKLAQLASCVDDIPQLTLQSLLFLHEFPDAISDDNIWSIWQRTDQKLVRSIALSFVSICWRLWAAHYTTCYLTGRWKAAISSVLMAIVIIVFLGPYVIDTLLVVWQCPWYVWVPTIILISSIVCCVVAVKMVRTILARMQDEEDELELGENGDDVAEVNLDAYKEFYYPELPHMLAPPNMRIKPFRQLLLSEHPWRLFVLDVVYNIVMLGLYFIFTVEIHKTVLYIIATMFGLKVVLFTVNLKVRFI